MKNKKSLILSVIGSSVLVSNLASANLLDLVDSFSTELERNSARAVWQTYRDLVDNTGCNDAMLVDPGTVSNGVPISCTGQTYRLFDNVRRLVHTANEISNDRNGGIAFSLGLDLRGLGLALRWNAAEEYNAQASLSSDFLQGQLSGLSTRITALRLGGRGNTIAGINPLDIYQFSAQGGTAGADDDAYSRWGGFIHYSGGSGKKSPTALEDAFDVEASDITFGGDYRFNSAWTAGVVVGLTDQEIDFDSAKSTVDGGIISDGFSLMPFVLYQDDNWFGSFALGYQSLSFDTERSIRYPSLNPDVASPNTRTASSTDATNTTFSGELGFNYQVNAFSAEPFVKLNYVDTSVDGFVERDLNDKAFNVTVAKQSFDSLESSVGLRLRYSFTPSFGVFTPFVSIQSVNQSNTDARTISARYSNSTSSDNAFQLSSDELDDQYLVTSYGIASVIRGGRQNSDGVVGGGLQIFVQFKEVTELDNYEYAYFTAGMRYEF
jgi:uncharacterized protein YhjY with autotransporter beta-barrel domain